MKYVNLTPRWTEILPTWLMIFEQAITGDCTNPDLIRSNTKEELRRMAQGADNFNDIVAGLRFCEEATDEDIRRWIETGRKQNEIERTTIKESDDVVS